MYIYMPKDTTYLMRMSKAKKASYESRAKKEGLNLAAWIESKLDSPGDKLPIGNKDVKKQKKPANVTEREQKPKPKAERPFVCLLKNV